VQSAIFAGSSMMLLRFYSLVASGFSHSTGFLPCQHPGSATDQHCIVFAAEAVLLVYSIRPYL